MTLGLDVPGVGLFGGVVAVGFCWGNHRVTTSYTYILNFGVSQTMQMYDDFEGSPVIIAPYLSNT